MFRFFGLILLLAATALKGSEVQTLTGALKHPRFWSQVHAAEYLIELGLAQEAINGFIVRQRANESIPVTRIGVWRVRALAAKHNKNHAEYARITDHIRAAAFAAQPDAPDRIHAVETLFKLNYKCTPDEQKILQGFCSGNSLPVILQIYSAALLTIVDQQAFAVLNRLFKRHQQDKIFCGVLLYVLQKYPDLPKPLLDTLQQFYCSTPHDSMRLTAALILLEHTPNITVNIAPAAKESSDYLRYLNKTTPQGQEYQKLLQNLKRSENIEIKIFAAYTALKNKQTD